MRKLFEKLITYIFHSNTIFVQLVVFTVIISIIPIVIISSLSFNKISTLVENTLNKSYSQLVTQYMTNMNDNFFRYWDRLQQVANNTIIIDELLDRGSDSNPYIKGNKVSVEVGKCLRLEGYNEFVNCMIYSNIKEIKIYGSKVSMLEEATREPWYLTNNTLKEGAFSYLASDGKSSILSLIEDINYVDTRSFKKEYLGFIKLDFNAAKLFEPIKEETEEFYPYNIIVLDEDNHLIYASDESLIKSIKDISFEDLSNRNMIFQENIMIYGDNINIYGFKIIFLFESDLFTKKQDEMRKSIIPMIFILIGIIIITAYFFTRSFSRRVECLVNKIKLVEEGNFEATQEIAGGDEVAVLDKQINSMLKQLEDLIRKNYIQQLEKKEAELRNLQLQINPHFLYNTLETISSIAAIKQAFDICDLCERLGEIFRYSLGKNYGEYVTIEQEMKHIGNYIFIQKARFGNKFDIIYNVENNLMKNQMLRFVLQPIVENAIVHGLSKSATHGILRISIRQKGEYILIEIQDNGVGMTKERLETLNDYINDNETRLNNGSKSIGVKNVNQRIKLVCGSDCGINIQSERGKGSCFTIRIPFV